MGKASRDKGKRGELELAKLWAEALPGVTVRRGGQDQAHRGEKSPDIITGGLFRIEAKRYAKITRGVLVNALVQAERDAMPGEIPVACCRADRGQWVAAMRLHDLVDLFHHNAKGHGFCAANGVPIVELPLSELLPIVREWYEVNK